MKSTWAVVGVLGLGTALLLALVLADTRAPALPPPSTGQATVATARQAAQGTPVVDEPEAPRPRAVQEPAVKQEAPAPAGDENLTGLKGYPPSGRYGQQADQDRLRLGPAAYTDMERLWARGKTGRGSPEAQASLEELLKRFPDTHRAGCASIELALHRLRDSRKSQKDRVAGAEDLLKGARDRYADSRCDGDVAAGPLAAMTLAVEVYRFSDPRMSRALLTEVAELPATELDARGQPLASRARTLLSAMPAETPRVDDTPPAR